MNLDDEAVQGEILSQYQTKTSLSKGNKISNIDKDVKGAKGTFDNFSVPAQTITPKKNSQTVGKSNAW